MLIREVRFAALLGCMTLSACGGGSGLSQSELANACVYIDACVGYNMTSSCIRGDTFPSEQIHCVLDAQTDCEGVLACLGARRDPEADCQDKCEGNVVVECQGLDALRYDCGTWALGLGPVCVEEQPGLAWCVDATCTDVDTLTCDGTQVRRCTAGGSLFEFDCAPSLCFENGRCSDAPPVPCSASFDVSCDGDFLVTCEDGLETRINCRDRDDRFTCRVIADQGGTTTGCELDADCSRFTETACSSDTDVTYCDADGSLASVDCTALGFSTCSDGACTF
jgi:hypothetical protein